MAVRKRRAGEETCTEAADLLKSLVHNKINKITVSRTQLFTANTFDLTDHVKPNKTSDDLTPSDIFYLRL